MRKKKSFTPKIQWVDSTPLNYSLNSTIRVA